MFILSRSGPLPLGRWRAPVRRIVEEWRPRIASVMYNGYYQVPVLFSSTTLTDFVEKDKN